MKCCWDMAIWSFSKWPPAAILGFDPTGNGTVRSAVPENPTLEPNMKGIGWCIAELWPFEVYHNLTGHRKPETADWRPDMLGDFIFCPMLLCSALDRQLLQQQQLQLFCPSQHR